jgi:hypothetical protein
MVKWGHKYLLEYVQETLMAQHGSYVMKVARLAFPWLVQFLIIFSSSQFQDGLGVNARSRMYQHSGKSPCMQHVVWV